VHWTQRAGSLWLKVLIERWREDGDSKNVVGLMESAMRDLRAFTIKRRSPSPPQLSGKSP
jgi:hypothetical protein